MITDVLVSVHPNDEPPHCAICGISLAEHLTFLWYPMCDTHRIKARGLFEWVELMCDKVYSVEEELKLGQEVVRFMREEEEQSR